MHGGISQFIFGLGVLAAVATVFTVAFFAYRARTAREAADVRAREVAHELEGPDPVDELVRIRADSAAGMDEANRRLRDVRDAFRKGIKG